MLCDAAHKYLGSSSSLAAAGVVSEQAQLQQLRPTLRQLGLAAAAQLQQCLALHRAGALLTHSSSRRACCLLLRGVLSLTAEYLDPAILQAPTAAADALAAQVEGFQAAMPPGGVPAGQPPEPVPPHMQALQDEVEAMQQQVQQVAQQAAHLAQVAQGLWPQQDLPPGPAAAAVMAGAPVVVAAAALAGVGTGSGLVPIMLPAAEALAQDAKMLMEVSWQLVIACS